MRILFLSRWYPYPPDNGSKIRIFNLLEGLCKTHEVTLLSFFDPEKDAPDGPLPSVRPAEISLWPYRGFNPRSLRASLGFLSSTPRFLVDTHCPQMARIIARTVRRKKFDVVVASQLEMASYIDCFRGTPAIFEEVELSLFCPDSADAHLNGSAARQKLTWEKFRRYLSRTVEGFRACTVASEVERRLLAAAAPAYSSVEVVPNSVNLDDYDAVSATRVPGSLVFAGSFRYAPNYEGMAWFLENVYPVIRTQVPEVQLTITGHPGTQPPLGGPGVRVVGHVSDVRSVVASSVVSVAPLRMGGGTRLKILESMALCTPVVTTSKGAEGLEARHSQHLLIADTPREFAQCVVSLLQNPDYARAIADRAYKLVQTHYDSRAVVSQLLRIIDAAVGAGTPSAKARASQLIAETHASSAQHV